MDLLNYVRHRVSHIRRRPGSVDVSVVGAIAAESWYSFDHFPSTFGQDEDVDDKVLDNQSSSKHFVSFDRR